jgi:uncharacterized membrane protein
LILFYLYVSLMLTDTAAMASLRGLTAWHALRYIRSLFRERLPRVLGVYAGLWLIGTLPSQLIQLLASELLANVEATWVSVVVMTVLQTILGIFTLYTAAAAVLMLLNYEAMRQREWKENQEQAR